MAKEGCGAVLSSPVALGHTSAQLQESHRGHGEGNTSEAIRRSGFCRAKRTGRAIATFPLAGGSTSPPLIVVPEVTGGDRSGQDQMAIIGP